jgi:hypothetical protein
MTCKYVWLIIFAVIGILSASADPQSPVWVARYNGTGSSSEGPGNEAMVVDSSGNIFVAGSTTAGGNSDWLVLKYNSSGALQWARTYNGPGDGYDDANGIAVDSAGSIYVCGSSTGTTTGSDFTVIKWNTNGTQLWIVRVNGSANSTDLASAIVLDNNANVYVTGYLSVTGQGRDFQTRSYNAAGALRWTRSYNGPASGLDESWNIAIDDNGNVAVSGNSENASGNSDYYTQKYRGSDGVVLWSARYNGSASGTERPQAIGFDTADNLYVTGGSNGDYATLKYNGATGAVLWTRRLDGGNFDTANDLKTIGSQGVVITGHMLTGASTYDWVTVRYDTSGNILWQQAYNGPGNSDDHAYTLTTDSGGNVLVTGDVANNYTTVMYSPSGNLVQVYTYNGTANAFDTARAVIAPAGANYFYVSGLSQGSGTGNDIVTIKYLLQDTTIPVAVITQPIDFECICDQFRVQGSANDPDGLLDYYRLEYQAVGAANWTTIITSSTPVSNNVLGIWNTPAQDGYYYLRLTVVNAHGLSNTDVVLVYVDKAPPVITLSGPTDGQILGGTICIGGSIGDPGPPCPVTYTVDYAPQGSNNFQPVDPNQPIYTGNVVNVTLATWNSTGVPDGNYRIRVSAVDDCGRQTTVFRTVVVDNTAPTAMITQPANCALVNGSVTIRGTANDANLAGWVLQYTGGNSHTWTTIASGNTPVINGQLGVWNTAGLPACAYTLRLVASDHSVLNCNGAFRNQAEYLVSVEVGIPGDLNKDGCVNDQDLLIVLFNFGTGCP